MASWLLSSLASGTPIAAHEAVEQPADLLWLPHELALYRGEDVVVLEDFLKGCFTVMGV